MLTSRPAKGILSLCLQLEINIVAAAKFQFRQFIDRCKSKQEMFKNKWRGAHRKNVLHIIWNSQHVERELCRNSPEMRKYLDKHAKYMYKKVNYCTQRWMCLCCHVIDPGSVVCPCKKEKLFVNIGVDKGSESYW